MNYILHFKPREGYQSPDVAQIKQYFVERENYSVNEFQALYNNNDTGVFFTFEYGGRLDRAAAAAGNITPVYFNISGGRPHIFVLEAEPELAEFIRTFGVLVSDLYMKGSGYREYDEMDFYRGWNALNESVYVENARSTPSRTLNTLPISLIEKCWRWNYHVSSLQSELGPEIFVPRIMFLEGEPGPRLVVVWTDAQPIALPVVEEVILYRRSLLPGLHLGKKEDVAVVKIQEIIPLLRDYPKTVEHFEYFTIIYKDPPAEIKKLVQSQKTLSPEKLTFVAQSDMHDREMIEKIKVDIK